MPGIHQWPLALKNGGPIILLNDSWCVSLIKWTGIFYVFLPWVTSLYNTQVLPISVPLRWVYSEIDARTKYFVHKQLYINAVFTISYYINCCHANACMWSYNDWYDFVAPLIMPVTAMNTSINHKSTYFNVTINMKLPSIFTSKSTALPFNRSMQSRANAGEVIEVCVECLINRIAAFSPLFHSMARTSLSRDNWKHLGIDIR